MQYKEVAGGICAPKGFAAAGVHCGIRANHNEKYDLALIKADVRCAAAGVYTTNKVCGAPIKVDRAHLTDGYAQAILVNSGNANTCAANGVALAEECCALVGEALHIPAEDAARKAIRILNPISENLSIMRTLLTPSMLNVIVDNLKKGNAEGRLFEMAPVYLAKELPISEHPHERQTLCIGAFGPEEDFFTVKGALEALAAGFGLTFDYQRETAAWLHPGISAAVYCNGKRLGVFGKLANEINAELEIAKEQKDSQNIYLGELDYEALMSCVEGELRYKPLSPYAPVKRDLALVCGEAVSCGEIEETIRKASPLVSEVKLFDIYRGANLGDGKKSMAFSLSLSDPKKEVSAEEVERVVKKILGNLKFKLGIEIR